MALTYDPRTGELTTVAQLEHEALERERAERIRQIDRAVLERALSHTPRKRIKKLRPGKAR
jgi:hypothetical protein